MNEVCSIAVPVEGRAVALRESGRGFFRRHTDDSAMKPLTIRQCDMQFTKTTLI